MTDKFAIGVIMGILYTQYLSGILMNDPKQNKQTNKSGFDGNIDDIFDLVLRENPNSTGRNTKCTPELIYALSMIVAKGNTVKDACPMVGITEATFYNWRARGEKEFRRIQGLNALDISTDVLETELIYLEFFESLLKAIPLRKAYLIEQIRNAGKESRNWTANAWLLERLHPDEFGRKQKIEIQDNFKMEIIKLIQDGTITFKQVESELGKNDAIGLFEQSGKTIPEDV